MPELETSNENNMNENMQEKYFNASVIKEQRRKYFSSAMWKLTLSLAILVCIQIAVAFPIGLFAAIMDSLSMHSNNALMVFYRDINSRGFITTINNIVSLFNILIPDCIALLCFWLFTKKTPNAEKEDSKLNFGLWFAMFIMCFGIGGIGSVLGMIVNAIITAPATLLGLLIKSFAAVLTSQNIVTDLTYGDGSFAYLLFEIPITAIFIPIVEELIFRKALIDKTAKYGYGPAILLSALTFGIFHGNFSQLFYAFGLGILFAYVYCYTGKVRYSIFMHMGYNFYAAAIIPIARKMIPVEVLNTFQEATEQFHIDANAERYLNALSNAVAKHPISIAGIIAVVAAVAFYLVLIIAGIILMIAFLGKFLRFRKTINLGEKGIKRLAIFNFGSILFLALGALLFSIRILADWVMTLYGTIISF